LRLWSLDDDLNASAITTITAEDNPWFTDIAFNPAGDVLAAATLEGDILLWDMRDLEEAVLMAQLNTDDPQRINALAFSPAGDLLAAGGDDQRVQIWQVDA
jgi:WD40 repeat protein